MKTYITIILVILLLVGCEYKKPDDSFDTSRSITYSTITIDSCEYINAYYKLAHKGNCKYCAKRRKKELEELIEVIKEAQP